MLGAAALTGLAAMRAGAGLTTIGVARTLNLTLQKKISNVIMTRPLPQTRQGTISYQAFGALASSWGKYSVVAMGPGMGINPSTARFIKKVYEECFLPVVVDADALNSLGEKGISCGRKFSAPRILTPHPGEMARLTGLSKEEIQADRKRIARDFAKRWGAVVVLKGHRTVVASPEGKVYVNKTGNSGMATAGSGDVLTGILGGFLARGMDAFPAAQRAVFCHGLAGDKVAGAMIATDMLDVIPRVF